MFIRGLYILNNYRFNNVRFYATNSESVVNGLVYNMDSFIYQNVFIDLHNILDKKLNSNINDTCYFYSNVKFINVLGIDSDSVFKLGMWSYNKKKSVDNFFDDMYESILIQVYCIYNNTYEFLYDEVVDFFYDKKYYGVIIVYIKVI